MAAAAAAFAVPSPKSSPLASRELNSAFLSGSPLKSLCLHAKARRSKDRTALSLVMASGGEPSGGGRFYFNFTGFPFPLGPFLNRQTLRYEVSYTLFDRFNSRCLLWFQQIKLAAFSLIKFKMFSGTAI